MLCHVDFDNLRTNINFKLHIYEFYLNVIGIPQCGLMVMYNACLFLLLGGRGESLNRSPLLCQFFLFGNSYFLC